MSYSKGFKKGHEKGFNDAFAMVIKKFSYSLEFAGVIRKKQMKIIVRGTNPLRAAMIVFLMMKGE